jgi:hypothetical protein
MWICIVEQIILIRFATRRTQPSRPQCRSRNVCCRNSFLKTVPKSTINGHYNRSILYLGEAMS